MVKQMDTEKRRDRHGRLLNKGESQLPDGRYMYRYRDKYGNRRKVYSWKLVATDTLPANARNKKSLRELEVEINQDKSQNIDTFTSKNTTLNDRWEKYIEKLIIKPSTKSNYMYLWNKYIKNELGETKIHDINIDVVSDFYIQLYKRKCLSKSTILSIHNLLTPVLDICVALGLMNSNPTKLAIKDIKDADKRNNGEVSHRTILTPEQEIAFIDFLKTDKRCEKWKNIFIVLLKTGARISEICGLTKNDVEIKKDVIHIRRNLLYRKIADDDSYNESSEHSRYFVSSTKTRAGKRDFPIYCDELKNALKDEMEKYEDEGCEIDGVSGWIFRNRYGSKPLTENNCNDGLRRVMSYYNESVTDKKLKIRDFTCHCFRHTFATKCEIKDVSERAKKMMLGHSLDKGNVTNIYVHPTFEYIQKEASKLNCD